jgi:hypothetical protein
MTELTRFGEVLMDLMAARGKSGAIRSHDLSLSSPRPTMTRSSC